MLNVIYTLELTEMGEMTKSIISGRELFVEFLIIEAFLKQVSSVSDVVLVVSMGSCFGEGLKSLESTIG